MQAREPEKQGQMAARKAYQLARKKPLLWFFHVRLLLFLSGPRRDNA